MGADVVAPSGVDEGVSVGMAVGTGEGVDVGTGMAVGDGAVVAGGADFGVGVAVVIRTTGSFLHTHRPVFSDCACNCITRYSSS